MRFSFTAFCAFAASSSVLVHAIDSASVEDTSELFQATAHLHEDPAKPETMQMVYKPLEKMREMLRKVQDTFNQEVKDVAREAVKQELEKTQIPDDVVDTHKVAAPASQEANASVPEAVSANADASVPNTAVEAAPTETPQTTFYLQMPSGRQIPSSARSTSHHLQAFMKGFCNRMHISCDTTKFHFKGQELKPLLTASDFGIQNGDVIDVSGPEIDMLEQNREADHKKAEEVRAKKLREEEEAAQEKAVEEHQQHVIEMKHKGRVAETQRQKDLQRQGMVTLEFAREVRGLPSGEEVVLVAVKQDKWLQGTMELVCKRMGIDVKTTKFFRWEPRAFISPHDSVQSLDLKERETIVVRAQQK